MPLNLYTGAALNKLNKSDLKSHIIDLYGFIKVFDGESIIKLKEENEEKDNIIFNIGDELKEYIDDYPTHKEGEIYTAIENILEENEKLKEKNDGYEALLKCECGVSIERVVEIKEENKKLKKENKKLKKENEDKDNRILTWKMSKALADTEIKELYKQVKELKKWSLSEDMIESTSAETIEEFESDVRENWQEFEALNEKVEYLKELLKNTRCYWRCYCEYIHKYWDATFPDKKHIDDWVKREAYTPSYANIKEYLYKEFSIDDDDE